MLASSVVVVPAASAEEANPQQAAALAERLGEHRTAGSYYDSRTGESVVAVTDQATARQVRAAGATPRLVTRSDARLDAVQDAVDSAGGIPGTAVGVDVRSNTVDIAVDESVTGAKRAEVDRIAAKHGSAVRVTRLAGTLRTNLTGGDEIRYYRTSTSYTWCSVGFNVVYDSNPAKHAFLSPATVPRWAAPG